MRQLYRARSFRTIAIASIFGLSIGAATESNAIAIRADYVGTNGLYNTPGNWFLDDPGLNGQNIIPDNGQPPPSNTEYNVFILDNAFSPSASDNVALTRLRTIDNLTIASGKSLNIFAETFSGVLEIDASDPAISGDPNQGGTILNDGTISLGNAPGVLSNQIRVRDGDLNLLGSGVIELSDSLKSRIVGAGAAGALIHGADHTISGAGEIGRNSLSLQNSGTILATAASGLEIRTTGGVAENSNNGLLSAREGGTLKLTSIEFDNTGGVVEALDGSLVELRSLAGSLDAGKTRIRGGTLRTSGSGVIRGISNEIRLEDIATGLGSRYEVGAGTETRVLGTIANDGSLVITRGAQATLTLSTEIVTFDGGGAILLEGNSTDTLTRGRIRRQTSGVDAPATSTLVNTAEHTIRGAGGIGVNTFFLDNRGLIDADGQGDGLRLTIDTTGAVAENSNSGVMRASLGGVLEFLGTAINNTGGVIQALDGSTVELRSSTISGGMLATGATGVIRNLDNGVIFQDVSVAADANIEVADGRLTTIVGGLNNDGLITLDSTSNSSAVQARLSIVADTTFSGNGRIVMSGVGSVIRKQGAQSATLTNDIGHTIAGEGELGLNRFSFINRGILEATAATTVLNIDPVGGGLFRNEGTINAIGAGGLTIVRTGNVAFETNGTVSIGNGSEVRVINGAFTQTGGVTSLNGASAELIAGQIEIFGGVLKGGGTVIGDLIVNGGSLAPGNSPGTLFIDGGFTLFDGSPLEVELGGTLAGVEYDQLLVEEVAAFQAGARIEIILIDPNDPLLGSNLFQPSSGEFFDIVTATDIDVQGGRPLLDLFVLPTLTSGLFFDAALLLNGDQQEVLRLSIGGQAEAPANVPEPATLLIFAAGLAGLRLFRRRHT